MSTAPSILEVRQISKRFTGVQALNDVSLELHSGEIHGLMGENGAGKSTLVKILTGTYLADQGEVYWKGELRRTDFPGEILDMGVSVVYQESSVIPNLSVGENIYLGRLPVNNGLIDWNTLWGKSAEVLRDLDLSINPKMETKFLSPVEIRMLEVAKAISADAELIIMDEPTTALSIYEIQLLFERLQKLRDKGIAILYISHFLEEVFQLSDRITVLRDGKLMKTVMSNETSPEEIVTAMAGRKLESAGKVQTSTGDRVVLEVVDLTRRGAFKDVSFTVANGEVLGLAGTIGAGRTRLVRSIFGLEKMESGEVHLNESLVNFHNPSMAIQAGVAFSTKNRRDDGLIMDAPVVRNITLPILQLLSSLGIMRQNEEKRISQEFVDRLSIKAQSLNQHVTLLSGGNQQKVVLAKWLAANTQLLILDEPTQGVDVTAKAEIYKIIEELSEEGISLLISSSEPEELERLCHRVLVMRRGKIVKELKGEDVNREVIIEAVIAGTKT